MTTNNTSDHIDVNLSQRVVELEDEVAAKLGKQLDTLRALTKEHPVAVLGVALGIGYLLARVLHR